MKNKNIALLLICIVTTTLYGAPTFHASSFLSPRSESVNAGRELVGWRKYINRGDKPGFYSAFYALAEYQQSYRANRIAEYFFGQQLVTISGSMNPNRNINDLLADYFGLSPAFLSDVSMFPQISSSVLDFGLYLGYGKSYFRIHAPVVWTTTRYALNEIIYENGAGVPFPALYMADAAIAAPAQSFTQAIQAPVAYGQVTEPLNFSRIAQKQCYNALSEPQLALGYNILATDLAHAGFNVRLSIPTGNRSKARYLFEAIVGNGHHWEAGIGFTGHWVVWEKDLHQSIAVYLDINLTHVCSAREVRSFDFIQSPPHLCRDNTNFASRYILLKEFDDAGNYTGNTIPSANVTTLPCKVSNDVQFDLAFMLAYSSCFLDIDLGYEAWIRSKEKITLCSGLPSNKYGLKGIQNVALAPAVPSNATESTATINGVYFSEQILVEDPVSPVFVNTGDLNLRSAANPTAFTNKIFWNISHAWENSNRICRWVIPFLGLGGQTEFESLNPRRCAEPNQNSIAQWAIWVKGGVTF